MAIKIINPASVSEAVMIAEIQKELAESANAQTAVFLQKFFKTEAGGYGEGDLFRGIRVPALRKLARKYQNVSLPTAEELLHSSFHEDRLLALLIFVRQFAKSEAAIRKQIFELYLNNTRFVNNWDLVDSSAEYIVGAYLRDKTREPLYCLAQSADLWERRIAIWRLFTLSNAAILLIRLKSPKNC